MTLPVLETERLVLRQIEVSDAEGLHGAFGNAEIMRFWDFPTCRDVAETASHIQQSRAVDASLHGMWAIIARAGGFAGMINYHHRESWNQRLELGVILTPLYSRQGLMTEAQRIVQRYCFSEMETHRVEAAVQPENIGARAFLMKLGFTEEGLLRDRLCVGGQRRSVFMYSLLKDEWDATGRANSYETGQGVPQDYVQAYQWLNLAASRFSAPIGDRDRIAVKMTPAQIAEAQRLASEWHAEAQHPWWKFW